MTQRNIDWQDLAACRGRDTEMFFRHKGRDQALDVCRLCPVRSECLEAALAEEWHMAGRGGLFGLRGGTSAAERGAIIRARKTRETIRRPTTSS